FMFFMIMLGVFVGFFVKLMLPQLDEIGVWGNLAYTGIRLLLLPIVVGIGFEFIMFAGNHDNFVTRAMSAPGLWVQRITTKEPTLDMLEVAIISIKCALRDDFPEFKEFYLAREWEKTEEAEDAEESTESEASSETEPQDVTKEEIEQITTENEAI
ncbi:MAG: DUF1385 domain-containing protein, partial [Clostridia bacterium]|nr:DUF1385 domain-containing protein [Clostridia bacterium]